MAVKRRTGLREGTPSWVFFAYVSALVLVFLGEHVVSATGWLRAAFTGVGVVAVLALTVTRWIASRVTSGERGSVERALAVLSTCGALAVVLYLTTAEPLDALGLVPAGVATLSATARHRYDAVATVAWVALVLGAVLPMAFAERALFPMRRAARVEWRRVRDAIGAGLTLAFAAVYGALFTFAAGEFELKADFSYFHTARPSETTRKMIESAREPLRVVAFFPDLNDVGAEVSSYLQGVAAGEPNVHLEVHDRLLFPQLARDLKANEDGVIVVQRGTERESLVVGTSMNTARAKLKSLDMDFQKAVLKALRERRTAYFTVGHGELNDTSATVANEGRTGQFARRAFEQQNYLVRDLSATSGLGVDVPDDASIVVVLGPAQPLLPEEIAALGRYADHGGRLLLSLDPDSKAELAPLGAVVGLTVSPSTLANDKVHVRRRYNDSDNVILATNRYSSHPSVSTLGRLASRPVVLIGAAALDRKAGADPSLKIDFAMLAMPDTFDDLNGNFHFDAPTEKRQPYPLAAAVSKPVAGSKKSEEMRAFVMGDADVVCDFALGNEANLILLSDAVRWLGGEESFAGDVQSPEDVRIEHTKQKDLLWFYGTIFAAPALVFGGGLVYTQRRRRSKSKEAAA